MDTFSDLKLLALGLSKKEFLDKAQFARKKWLKKVSVKTLQLNSINAIRNQERTSEELKISKVLKENKINFEQQIPFGKVGNIAGILIIDFQVKLKNNIFFIETSKFDEANRKRKRNLIMRARLLAWKGFRIKKINSKIKTIVAIKMPTTNKSIKAILAEAFDFVIVNDFSKIPSLLKISAEDGI